MKTRLASKPSYEVNTEAFVSTLKDPVPKDVIPSKGPEAGGTLITITGEHLDTASKDDISITVGGEPCEV